jgi:hypothetical protein
MVSSSGQNVMMRLEVRSCSKSCLAVCALADEALLDSGRATLRTRRASSWEIWASESCGKEEGERE